MCLFITFSVNILSSCVLIPDFAFFNKKQSLKGTSVWVLDMELMNSQTYEQNHFVDLNLIFRQHPIRTIFKLLKLKIEQLFEIGGYIYTILVIGK